MSHRHRGDDHRSDEKRRKRRDNDRRDGNSGRHGEEHRRTTHHMIDDLDNSDHKNRHKRREKTRGEDYSSSRRRHSRKRHRGRYDDDDASSSVDSREERNERKRSRRSHKKSSRDDEHHKDSSKRKDKKRKSEKRSKRDDRPKKSSSKTIAQPPNKKFLINMGNALGRAPDTLINPQNDYFTYHQHLWVYLHREEGLAFNDMTSEETHEAFFRFAQQYNSGDLESDYYDPKGLPPAALEEAKTTRHTWSFQTSEMEDQNLHSIQTGVRKQTDADPKSAPTNMFSNKSDGDKAVGAKPSGGGSNAAEPGRPPAHKKDWAADRTANRRLREHVRTAEEEFGGGRKEGHERTIEKRKELSTKIHGAARDRTAGVELTDDAIYGGGGGAGGDSDFQAALTREKRRAAERQSKQESRVAQLQEKEKNKQEEMLKMLGLSNLKPGQKITIAPRNDGNACVSLGYESCGLIGHVMVLVMIVVHLLGTWWS